jgi:hypothetical protein
VAGQILDFQLKSSAALYSRVSNRAAILNSGKSKFAAILTAPSQKSLLYYKAAIQIAPLFNIAESHIL